MTGLLFFAVFGPLAAVILGFAALWTQRKQTTKFDLLSASLTSRIKEAEEAERFTEWKKSRPDHTPRRPSGHYRVKPRPQQISGPPAIIPAPTGNR
ncbi:hypothetical protein RGI145_19565 [Roseomonas gilardii]|uniref:Uncharacterized protein n=1 Tax=Roseomonas gilardii TaxID=257708 RepID=A0A1L7ALC3_9PROT|nr:hypothetical protein [Roseomonas gilardii]APT59546.1 hypothetical protein RGI145_19565 [Roseomonas gilardii]